MRVIVEGTPLINPTAGIIYAASHEIYPIVGKFSFMVTDKDGKRLPGYGPMNMMFRGASAKLCEALGDIMRRFPWANCAVFCDETLNPPELLKQGKLCVMLMIQQARVAEYYSDRFILGRKVDARGDTFMTIQGIPSSLATDAVPLEKV
jgi:hypothetical protein